MNNFDKLDKVISGEDGNDKVVSVVEPKVEQPTARLKNANLLNAFIATIKRDDEAYLHGFKNAETLPIFKYTTRTLLVFCALLVAGLLINTFLPAAVSIPIMLVVCPLFMPLITMIFASECNVKKDISLYKISLYFVSGAISYLLLKYLADSFLVKIILEEQLETYVMPIINTVFSFVICFIIANTNKTVGLAQCFVVAVSFVMGYVYAELLVEGFARLFITEQLSLSELQAPFIEIIVNDEGYLKRSLHRLFDEWYNNYLVYPVLCSFWAIILGTVVSMSTEFKDNRRDMPKSVYLLLVLIVIFRILYLLETSFFYLDAILRIVSIIGSAFTAIKFINYSFSV